jgi:hypothetical protein
MLWLYFVCDLCSPVIIVEPKLMKFEKTVVSRATYVSLDINMFLFSVILFINLQNYPVNSKHIVLMSKLITEFARLVRRV